VQDPDHRQPQRIVGRRLDSATRRRSSRPAADALELNIYYIPTDLNLTSAPRSSRHYLDILEGRQGGGDASLSP
jgi:hypothetical protein